MESKLQYIRNISLKRDRGWSNRLIDLYLGEPDKTEPNPFASSRPIKLYLLSRVLNAEESLSFKNELAAIIEKREVRQNYDRQKIAEKILNVSDKFLEKRGTDLQKVIFDSNDFGLLVIAKEVVNILSKLHPESGQLRKLKSIVNSKIRRIK